MPQFVYAQFCYFSKVPVTYLVESSLRQKLSGYFYSVDHYIETNSFIVRTIIQMILKILAGCRSQPTEETDSIVKEIHVKSWCFFSISGLNYQTLGYMCSIRKYECKTGFLDIATNLSFYQAAVLKFTSAFYTSGARKLQIMHIVGIVINV